MRNLDRDRMRHDLEINGYVVIPGVVSNERITAFCRALTEAYDRAPRFKGGGSINGHLNCFPGEQSRFFYEELAEAGIIDFATSMRAGRSSAVRPSLNYNLPGSVAQHYHVDGPFTQDFLICNIAMVDTDVCNGAIDVLPGTHREFLKFWRYAVNRKYRLTTRVPLQTGDVLVRVSTLWHRGMPNLTAAPRPMMALTFGEGSAPEGDPFTAHGEGISFYPNWYSTSWLGQLRERTFKVAPISYSAYRFVASLRGNKGYSTF